VIMDRRSVIVSSAALGSLVLSGCASTPRTPLNDRHCYWARTRSRSKPTCTAGPIPDLAADERAKRFEPVPGRLVIYVVRHRWGDTVNMVRVGMMGGALVSTTPASMVRLVVPPGGHRLVFEWAKGQGSLDVRGEAGQVLFVELVGSLWFWNEYYRFETGESSLRDRALKCRLVADVDGKG
jgi:hypothetical protein